MLSMGLDGSSIPILMFMRVYGKKEFMKGVAGILGIMEICMLGIGKTGKYMVEGL